MKMRLALAQMNISTGNLPYNMQKAEEMISAAAHNADLILLPELWSSGYDLSHAVHWATANEQVTQSISDLACDNNIWIGGSLLKSQKKKVHNTFSLIDPNGKRHAAYNKIHLFKLMDEDRFLTAGNSPIIAQLPWANTGLAVCYDLRFPELFRHYALYGARLILIIAEWPLMRSDHWRTLLRARAIENQLFIAAVNAVGDSGGTIMGGHSTIIDPWGNIIVEGSANNENLLTAELDFDLIGEARNAIPALSDRRPDIYSSY
jgi:omega-amidase